jgi:putative phosphoesterase
VILGILSDTHGRHERTARAIRLLAGLGATGFIHCGDLGGERVLDELAGRRAWFVWGNMDRAGPILRAYAKTLGLPVPESVPLRLDLDGRRIAVFHGHEPQFTRLARLLQTEHVAEFEQAVRDYDYILFGHSHRVTDVRIGRVHRARLINPGALDRARLRTVATLDLKRDVVEFWHVDDQATDGEPPRRFHP